MAISLKESVITGFSDFWSRKIRSLVTVLGIVLGTMSIIVVLALVNGINQKTLEWMMERGGLSKITINRNWEYENKDKQRDYFTYKEFQQIHELVPEAEYFTARKRRWFQLSFGQKKYWAGINGVMPDFKKVEEWDVSEGRFLTDFDLKNSNDVICIGSAIKEELFGSRNPIGKYITFNDKRFLVIGTMEHRFLAGNGMGRDNQLEYLNRRAYIPLTTMMNKLMNEDSIQSISLKTTTVEEAPAMRLKLENILLNIRKGKPVFRVESAQESAEEMKENSAKFKIIFFLISAISLLVGGIVIMNIMLATIQERTREIGIRIAVGARRIDIFMQFLIQTVLVTAIGGILGIAIGLSILNLVSGFLGFPLVAGGEMIVISLVVSAGIGLVFGISPAIKASKLDPVEALRHE